MPAASIGHKQKLTCWAEVPAVLNPDSKIICVYSVQFFYKSFYILAWKNGLHHIVYSQFKNSGENML